MKFAAAQPAPAPKSEAVKIGAWVYTGLLVVMVVGQLFAFEKFIPLIGEYGLPGGEGTATVIASFIVITEVFALPFLLRMPLSPLARWFSMACGLLTAITWVALGCVAVIGSGMAANSGLLGTKVAVPSGWSHLAWAIGMALLAVWSAWGLWPLRSKKR